MTKEKVKAISDILQEEYGLDILDIVEFWMYYERKTGEHIPDACLGY